ADPTQGNKADIKVREVLATAARRLDAGAAAATQPRASTQPSLAKQPAVEATVRAALGRTYLVLGLYPEAETQLASALKIGRRAIGETAPQTLKIMSDLGVIDLYTARYADAEKMFQQALDARLKLLGPDHPDTGDSYY